jgi:hypothetical protein
LVWRQACAWALAADHSILMSAEDEDAPDSPRSGQISLINFRVHVAHSVENSAKSLARRGQFRERIQWDLGGPDLCIIFFLLKIRNRGTFALSCSFGGALRNVINVGRDAVDALTTQDERR